MTPKRVRMGVGAVCAFLLLAFCGWLATLIAVVWVLVEGLTLLKESEARSW